MADMSVPDTIPGIKDALLSHMMENNERFGNIDASVKALVELH